jgi:2-haloacid dehalogenase
MMTKQSPSTYPKAVLFDLLTALLDSWTLWNRAAGSEATGRAWRAAYLRLTYNCGAYVPYEELVTQAALQVGLRESAARTLDAQWLQLAPWSGAQTTLRRLAPHCRLAIVTNCSRRLGEQAAGLFDIDWDVIVTAESAGFYKPDARPYQMALDRLNVSASDAAFVAGSSYDLFGTEKLRLRTYWHNRVGLDLVEGAKAPESEGRTFDALLPWLRGFHSLKDHSAS